jgi:hypothetical protein
MSKAIQAFYNPTKQGDTFKGLFPSDPRWDGRCADRVVNNLPEFLQEAGRDYYIKRVPAGVLDPTGAVDENGNVVPGWIEVENQFHLVRSSDHAIVSPHTVTESYAPLSLMDVAEEVSPWVEAGWASPDAVFEARGGALEVLSLRLDAQGEITDDDFFTHYVILQNPHGSGGQAKGKIISFRVVCCNTFAAAVSMASDFKISHRVARGDSEKQQEIMAERARDAIAAWEKVQEHIADLSEKVNRWNDSPITIADANELTRRLLEIKPGEEVKRRKKTQSEAIMAAFNMPTVGTYGRSGYDWINAVTYVQSSPLARTVKKSKVSTIDRAVRNMDPNGTGFRTEVKAEKILAGFIG